MAGQFRNDQVHPEFIEGPGAAGLQNGWRHFFKLTLYYSLKLSNALNCIKLSFFDNILHKIDHFHILN